MQGKTVKYCEAEIQTINHFFVLLVLCKSRCRKHRLAKTTYPFNKTTWHSISNHQDWANHYIVNLTFKISYMLAFTSLHFPWRVNFCTFCYLFAKYMNRIYEKRKQIEEVEEKYVCPIACMIKSIQHTSILFGNLRQRFNPFCIENIYTTTTYFNGIQQSFNPSV